MGATLAEQVGVGKTMREAYDRAVAEARDYYGHQEGYSGAINSKDGGFVPVALPPRFTYRKLQALLEDYDEASMELEGAREDVRAYRPGGIWYDGKRGWKGKLRKAEAALRRATVRHDRLMAKVPAGLVHDLDRLSRDYSDKWGPPLAVELRGAEAKQFGPRERRRGQKVFLFFGYAPC